MQHLMSPLDLSVEELDKLLTLANDIERNPQKYAHACEGKKLATCFYEPSTRTRLSFEAAMLNLGGSVLGFSTADSSSAAKGESVSDTIRVISCYADICAMRHPKEGAPLVASEKSTIPVINAGDGAHKHATAPIEAGPVDGAPDILDSGRILADEIIPVFLHAGQNSSRVSLQDSLSPAGEAFVCDDLHKPPAGTHKVSVYLCDFHNLLSFSFILERGPPHQALHVQPLSLMRQPPPHGLPSFLK